MKKAPPDDILASNWSSPRFLGVKCHNKINRIVLVELILNSSYQSIKKVRKNYQK